MSAFSLQHGRPASRCRRCRREVARQTPRTAEQLARDAAAKRRRYREDVEYREAKKAAMSAYWYGKKLRRAA